MVWVLSLSHRTSGIILTAGMSLRVVMHFSTIIYNPSVCMYSSLSLSLPHSPGVSAGSIAYLVSGKSFPEFITGFQSVAHYPALWTATKFIVALPLCYHMVNGIRHLVSSSTSCRITQLLLFQCRHGMLVKASKWKLSTRLDTSCWLPHYCSREHWLFTNPHHKCLASTIMLFFAVIWKRKVKLNFIWRPIHQTSISTVVHIWFHTKLDGPGCMVVGRFSIKILLMLSIHK